jgi:MoaA/NifB/PqqE/SkfB family radical SAM enzyme
MSTPDLIRRPEAGLHKTLLYHRSTKQLRIVDPEAAQGGPARDIAGQGPILPGVLSAPLKVFFSITRQCHLDCPMCFAKGRSYQQPTLPAVAIKALIETLGRMGVLEIRLTGGEPTIHPDFFDLVEWCADAGINVSINTHGVYSPRTLARLREGSVGDFHVSVDGPREIHEYLRGAKTFQRTLDTIRELRMAGKSVRINTIVFQHNRHALGDMIRLAETLQVPVRFCPMRALGKAKAPGFADGHILALEEWQQLKASLAILAAQASVPVTYFSNDEIDDFNLCEGRHNSLDRSQCSAWLTQMGIDAEGDAYAGGCIDDTPKSASVGSILERPVSELWADANRYVCGSLLPSFPRCVQCAQCSPELLWDSWGKTLSTQAALSTHLF